MPTPPPVVDMRDPAFRSDPHPVLHAVRARGRAERDVVGIWLATHHADCSAGLRSSALSREVTRTPGYAQLRPFVADSTLERTCERWMLFNDPPVHTRLRRLVNAAFKPAVVQALRARVAGHHRRAAGRAAQRRRRHLRPDADAGAAAAGARDLRRARPAGRRLRADQAMGRRAGLDRRARGAARRAPGRRPRRHRDGGVPARAHRPPPRQRRARRPARHAGGGARRRRRRLVVVIAERRRAAGQPDPAVRGRPRDHHQPARQRPADAAAPPRGAGAAARRPREADARRGGRDAALRELGEHGGAARGGALCHRRHGGAGGGRHLLHDRGGESGPGGVCRAGSVRHHAQPEPASGVRGGDSLLRGGAAGEDGGGGGVRAVASAAAGVGAGRASTRRRLGAS